MTTGDKGNLFNLFSLYVPLLIFSLLSKIPCSLCEIRVFSKRCSNQTNLKLLALRFSVDGKDFENEDFQNFSLAIERTSVRCWFDNLGLYTFIK